MNSRSGAQDSSQNPFLNPDPLFVLPRPGQEHTLILNRYPVYRNSLLIHTNTFKSQADDLDETDLTACWKCLQVLTKKTISSGTDEKQWLMIYNCGLEAGTSQGHKHMQLWPVPSTSELGFDLFPGQVESTREITTVCDIPFKHFILRLPEGASVEDVIVAYNTILPEIKRCHEKYGSSAYNVVMTQQWLMLVPRCSSGSRWGLGGNTAVVLGLLWISEDEKRDLWEEYGISNHLARLGIPSINL